MRSTLNFDEDKLEYGAATTAIRALARRYNAIDWFERPSDARPEAIRSVWRRHVAAVDRFSGRQSSWSVEVEVGGWQGFIARATQVRAPAALDWRSEDLKRMNFAHNEAHQFERHDVKGLFFKLAETEVYNAFGPRFAQDAALGEVERDAAVWYASYAEHDVRLAIEWQCCEPAASLNCNPFVSLIDGYAAGVYPFVLARDRVVLFTFR